MAARKEVFISATSADLRSYRQVVKDALLTLGAHPIEESNFPTDYREEAFRPLAVRFQGSGVTQVAPLFQDGYGLRGADESD